MGLLPDIVDGKLAESTEPVLYTPPEQFKRRTGEKRLEELNNLGLKVVAEDFSDASINS